MAAATQEIFDTDSDDDLPAGWEERVTLEGRVYYANHSVQSTQWEHPTSGKRKRVSGALPFGWEAQVDKDGNLCYIDHVNKRTTYTDPRLAFAQEDKDSEMIVPNKKPKFDGNSSAVHVLTGRDLSQKYVIVTGANTGIGFETARALAVHGAHVTLACRDVTKGRDACDRIRQSAAEARVTYLECDLTSLRSVHQFACQYKELKWPLNVLILNAGVFSLPWRLTEDGFDATFQTNHLAQFYLSQLLADLLVQSAPSRVVVLSSESHRFSDLKLSTLTREHLSPSSDLNYSPMMMYNNTKLCNVVFARQLNARLYDRGVTCNSVHPGNLVPTSISRYWWLWRLLFTLTRPFTKSVEQGAATSVYCAVAREVEGVGGFYLNNCTKCPPSPEALNSRIGKLLWDMSEQMLVSYPSTTHDQQTDT